MDISFPSKSTNHPPREKTAVPQANSVNVALLFLSRSAYSIVKLRTYKIASVSKSPIFLNDMICDKD